MAIDNNDAAVRDAAADLLQRHHDKLTAGRVQPETRPVPPRLCRIREYLTFVVGITRGQLLLNTRAWLRY